LPWALPAAAALVFVAAAFGAAGPRATPKKILFFSKSSGFEHDGIKADGRPGHGFAFRVMRELAGRHALDVTYSKDGSRFTADYLAQFDAFVFYTTGDLTLARNNAHYGDDQSPLSDAGKTALLRAIEHGKGFVGLHCAADTFHSPGGKDDDTPARYENDGERADPYVRMLGGEFIKHDAQQKARQIVADSRFPGIAEVPADFSPREEWYSLKNFAPDLHVLLVQETQGMAGRAYQRPRYPSTWARLHGEGRVFYSSMGHREDVWTNPVFQSVLAGAIDWATRRVDADVTPNLDQVAPEAYTLPKFVPPTGKLP
jgi:type 1 glutamine amidotransferase